MLIWLINHYAVPPQYYPLARQYNFAKYLIRMGHEVRIIAASTVHNSSLNLITDKQEYREEVVDGILYTYIKCRNYEGNGLKRIYNMYEFAWKLPKICDKFEKPDAIVSTSMPPMSCAEGIKIAKRYECRAIAEIADLWPESIIEYGYAGKYNPAVLYLRKLEKWIYTNADKIVFTMEGAYDYIVEQGWEMEIPKSKVSYINNGVDLEIFDYNKKNYVVDDVDLTNPEIFKIVYTGSIRKVNNLGLLLDIAKEVKSTSARFLIWGDGDERELLEKRVVDEHITNVIFKGKVGKEYIPYITSCANLNYAHNNPSGLFRFGISFNKLFDYFAAGKPILTDFPCKYNPMVMERAGIEVKDTNIGYIAKIIDEIVNMDSNQYEEMARKAREASIKYSFSNLTSQLVDVIESL